MIVLVATYLVRTGQGDVVLHALREMAALVRDHEPECLVYEVSRSSDVPEAFVLYERYRDQAAFEAHRETPHFKAIVEERILPLLERRDRNVYVNVIA